MVVGLERLEVGVVDLRQLGVVLRQLARHRESLVALREDRVGLRPLLAPLARDHEVALDLIDLRDPGESLGAAAVVAERLRERFARRLPLLLLEVSAAERDLHLRLLEVFLVTLRLALLHRELLGAVEAGARVGAARVEADRLEERGARVLAVARGERGAPLDDETPRLGLVLGLPVRGLDLGLASELDPVRLREAAARRLRRGVEPEGREEGLLSVLDIGLLEELLTARHLLARLLLLEGLDVDRALLLLARVVEASDQELRLGGADSRRHGVRVERERGVILSLRLAELVLLGRGDEVSAFSAMSLTCFSFSRRREVGPANEPVGRQRDGERGDSHEGKDAPVARRPLPRAIERGRAARRDRQSVEEALQVLAESGRRLIALARVLLDRLERDRVDLPGETGPVLRGRRAGRRGGPS